MLEAPAMSEAALQTAAEPKTRLTGIVDLLESILAELGREAGPRHPELASAEAARDPAAKGPTATLGALVDRLDERGFGFLFFLLALPCIPPFVYVLPQIVSLPMLALAGQMAMGRRSPWFPERLRRRSFAISEFSDVLAKLEKYVRFAERFARPRLRAVTGHGAARIVGALLVIPAVSILVPLIGTNTVPSIGIAITALGLVSRDGILVILGLLIGVLWPILLFSLIAFLGVEGLEIAKAWLLSRF
jgi:hypothetical protein